MCWDLSYLLETLNNPAFHEEKHIDRIYLPQIINFHVCFKHFIYYAYYLVIVKTNLNSSISFDNARHAKLDNKHYHYGALMSEYECTQMSLSSMPDKLII